MRLLMPAGAARKMVAFVELFACVSGADPLYCYHRSIGSLTIHWAMPSLGCSAGLHQCHNRVLVQQHKQ